MILIDKPGLRETVRIQNKEVILPMKVFFLQIWDPVTNVFKVFLFILPFELSNFHFTSLLSTQNKGLR